MAENTAIEWATHTFNPWRGCTKISPGCANCYAETLSHRNPGTLGVWGPKGTRVVAAESAWKEPLKWNKVAEFAADMYAAIKDDPKYAGRVIYEGRPRVFCASLADVFEDWQGAMVDSAGKALNHQGIWQIIGNPWYDPLTMSSVRIRLGDLICRTPNLDWLLLTKRPENATRMMADHMFGVRDGAWDIPAVPSNLWIGTSVENQDAADARIPHLLQVPAAVRFLSVEPLLGPIDLDDMSRTPGAPPDEITEEDDALGPPLSGVGGIDWVIVGGESGPDARPCRVEWIRAIVQQCRAAGVPCFVKQFGSNPEGDELWRTTGRLRRDKAGNLKAIQLARAIIDRKGGDPAEWPEDLRVREFPKAGGAS